MSNVFIGRSVELERLNDLLEMPVASLVVVKGRRRIGKSRLLREFAKKIKQTYFFSGLPPTPETTAQSQRQEFNHQLTRELNIRGVSAENWGDMLWHLAQKTQKGQVLIVLDEITWMGSYDADFLGQLKNAWDLYFSQNPHLILALSGSMSAWIEKNILSSTGFLGRESLTLTLRELPLDVCKAFWTTTGEAPSVYEMLRVLAVTGGVPRYLEAINPHWSAEENIRRLGFMEGGILVSEFEKIFSDLFAPRNELYKKIVTLLATGDKSQAEIAESLGYKTQGDMGEYLEELVASGFVSRDFTWNIHKGGTSNLSRYRLSDNYARFYLKYIMPNHIKIERGLFDDLSLTALPGWASVMGLQIENCILANHKKIKTLLRIPSEEVEMDGPFFQRKTVRHPGCQIDYMVQTRAHVLYACEIKFSRHPVGMMVVEEMKQKIASITLPKQYFCRPVLIHVNGVTDEVIDSQYFSRIIDMAELFK